MLRDEAGWTLVELMITAGLLAVVLTAILSLLDTTNKLAPVDQERAHDLRETQVGVYRMTRELRQGHSLVQTGPYVVEAHVYAGGADHDVVYDCSGASSAPDYGQCIRYEKTGGSPGPSTPVVDGLLNKPGSGLVPVFTYTQHGGKTTYGNVRVEVSAKGTKRNGYSHRIVFQDGFYLRNLDLG